MASKGKSDSKQHEENGFSREDANKDGVGSKTESDPFSKVPASELNTPGTSLHSSFTSKTPAPLSLMYTHNDLQRNVQQLVDDINAKRKRDADTISEVRKALDAQINNSANILEETLVGIYEQNSKVIQEKLQEIFAALDRISNLERELSEFKQALGLLYQDLRDPI